MTFKAMVHISESTGAGYGLPAHLYISGTGIAFSNSPKKALQKATELAEINKSKSAVAQGLHKEIGLIPIWAEVQLTKNGKVIHHAF